MASFAQKYAEAVYPDRAEVLGLRLEPPSIGHWLLLWRVKSPLVLGGGGMMRAGSLALALYILSRPCGAAAAGLQTRRARLRMKLWGWQFRFLCRDLDRIKAQAEMVRWLERSWQRPEFWESEKKGKTLTADILQSTKCRLMQCFGISRAEALAMPLREALWDLACHAEDQGVAEWIDDDDDAALDEVIAKAAAPEKAEVPA